VCEAHCHIALKSSLPSVRRARPPVGVHKTVEQLPQRTTVWECENTVVLRSSKQQDRADHQIASHFFATVQRLCRRAQVRDNLKLTC
jgi:hypothetical protein